MDETEMMSMSLLKCEGCGLYHFCLGNITLNLTEKELWGIGNVIAQAVIGIKGGEGGVSKNVVLGRHSNLTH